MSAFTAITCHNVHDYQSTMASKNQEGTLPAISSSQEPSGGRIALLLHPPIQQMLDLLIEIIKNLFWSKLAQKGGIWRTLKIRRFQRFALSRLLLGSKASAPTFVRNTRS
jgi:hypothetical protein